MLVAYLPRNYGKLLAEKEAAVQFIYKHVRSISESAQFTCRSSGGRESDLHNSQTLCGRGCMV